MHGQKNIKIVCASAVCEIADLLSLTRTLQVYRIEGQHPPRHPQQQSMLKSQAEHNAQYSACWHHGAETYRVFITVSVTFFFFLSFQCLPSRSVLTHIEYTNVSVYNTTIYFIYIKYYIDGATCFDFHWVILRPSKKTDPRLHICFTETHCGIPNAHRML